MNDIQQQIEALTEKIGDLAKQQTNMSRQILSLMNELERLKLQASGKIPQPQSIPPPQPMQTPELIKTPEAPTPPTSNIPTPNIPTSNIPTSTIPKKTLEEFIGGNLTSKVGILITIIGIFIGAKYAIEHNLVSPVVRVIAGYISGLVLIGIAARLRKKYEQYSSVLMGGGLAVLYFITYIAYSFYGMLPQLMAFGLMLIFTGGTVYAALLYNRIIIAHLGLVGAYAIPILLSDNSGRYAVLLTYISIINAGILALSFRKYWKSLFYVSFIFTWLIYSVWFTFQYRDQHFSIAFIFLSIFFLIFYVTFLAYKLVKKEQYAIWDVMLLLSNAFLFYGFGYSLLNGHAGTEHLLGAFTLGNAVIHLAISLLIRKLQLADKALFYLLVGLVISFITIAVPVQLDGNWVTLLWTMEAVLVFFIGRTQQRRSYEKLGMILLVLSFLSLLEDWTNYVRPLYSEGVLTTPFLNIVFITGLFVAIAQGAIIYLHHQKKLTEEVKKRPLYLEFYDYVLPCVFLLTAYLVFEFEIQSCFDRIKATTNASFAQEVQALEYATVMLYSMSFAGLVAYINQTRIKSRILGIGAMLGMCLCIIALLINGLTVANHLSMYYFTHAQTYFGVWNVLIRYLLMLAAVVLLALGQRSTKLFIKDSTVTILYTVFIHVAVLTIISFEYLNWAGLHQTGNEHKLGLSILWSVYALGLVVLGINKKKKPWRLTGICFFIVTLVKLFLYDLNKATTISKTLSFISLGAILLLVSYLYNRYKDVILADDEENKNRS